MATKKAPQTAPGLTKLKIIDHVQGLFLLPYSIGQIVDIDEKLAKQLIGAKCAEKV